MIVFTPQTKIFLAIQCVDFRKGIDALAGLCKKILQEDPFGGSVFVFKNRAATALKILYYDGQGFLLLVKRFSQGKIKWWSTLSETQAVITSQQLHVLLFNGNPNQADFQEDFKPLLKPLSSPSPSSKVNKNEDGVVLGGNFLESNLNSDTENTHSLHNTG